MQKQTAKRSIFFTCFSKILHTVLKRGSQHQATIYLIISRHAGFALHYDSIFLMPPLKSSQNGGSSAVKTLHKPKQSYIYSPLGQTFCISYHKKVEYLLNFSSFSKRLYEYRVRINGSHFAICGASVHFCEAKLLGKRENVK
jgi:hypothetical protein